MAEVMRGDVSNIVLPGQGGRHYSVGGPTKSKSPHGRLGMRSNSPHLSLAGRPLSPAGRALLGESQGLDMSNAYRRLSDAHLARSGGSLSELTRRKRSDVSDASGRLAKDYMSPDGDLIEESSDDEHDHSSSDEENERGRKAARNFPDDRESIHSTVSDMGGRDRGTLSLLAAAEEERE